MSPRMGRSGPAVRGHADIWSSPETAGRVLDHVRAAADASGEAVVSARGVAAALDLGPNTIKRAFRRLVDTRQLVLVRRGTGSRYASRYRVVSASVTATPAA